MILKFHCSSLLFQCSSVPTFIILLLLLLFCISKNFLRSFLNRSPEKVEHSKNVFWGMQKYFGKNVSILDQFQIWYSKKIPSKSSHPHHEHLPVNFYPCILIVLVNKSGFRGTLKFRWQKLYKWETLAHAVIPLLNQKKICTLWCE